MTYTVSITSQGQITIPAKIRQQLGLHTMSKAIISVREGEISVRPVNDILDLRGSLKTAKKPLTNTALHDLFSSGIVKNKLSQKKA